MSRDTISSIFFFCADNVPVRDDDVSIICAFVFLLSPSSLWLFGRKPVGRKAIENMEKKERERIEERQARIDNVMAVRQGRKEGGRKGVTMIY